VSDEQGWLARIAEGDDERLVYADWLDQQGRSDEAEFVRAEHQLHAAKRRLAAVESRLDAGWRRAVSRPTTEGWTVIHVHVKDADDRVLEGFTLVPDADVWPALRQALEECSQEDVQLIQRAFGMTLEWWWSEEAEAELARRGQAEIERADRMIRQETWANEWERENRKYGFLPALTVVYAPERSRPPALPEGFALHPGGELQLGGLPVTRVYALVIAWDMYGEQAMLDGESPPPEAPWES
jgi:uncharacterized protein (TIGR02996 family)